MRLTASLLLVLGALACPASAEEEFAWVFEEEYTFLGDRDPGSIVIQNTAGERSELDYDDRGLARGVVESWPANKTIRVAYSPERGTEVVDPASGERYPVPGAWPKIDALHERCKFEGPSIRATQACDEGALAAWDREMMRAYKRLMISGFSKGMKAAIRNTQREWVQYRNAQRGALAAYAAQGGGQVRRLQTSALVLGLTKDRAGPLLAIDAPAPAQAVVSAESLPLERGYFVLEGDPCENANNFSVTLHTGYGINASKAHCSFTRIEKTGDGTYWVTEECSLIQGGSFSKERELVIDTQTSYVSYDPSDGSEWAARHCPQPEMSEPFRSNDLSRLLK